ncbi:MAG: SGNH/GDSL hydrolase family protein [Planctomycetota bacterium]|jgi:lysophospholipase L1-like esterase
MRRASAPAGPVRPLVLLAGLLVALGVAGLMVIRARAPGDQPGIATDGLFWRALSADGRALTRPPDQDGLILAPGSAFRLRRHDDSLDHLEQFVVDARVPAEASLDVRLREWKGKSYAVVVTPGRPFGVRFEYRERGAAPVVLRSAVLEGAAPGAPFRVQVDVAQDTFSVSVSGHDVLSCQDARLTEGGTSLVVRGGVGALLSVSAAGRRTLGGGSVAPFADQVDFRAQPGASLRRHAESLGLALGALLLACLYLRALCLGRPGVGHLLVAGLVSLAPVAIPFAVGLVRDVPRLLPAAAALGVLGLVLGLRMLRGVLWTVAPRSAHSRRLDLAVIVLLVGSAGGVVWLRQDLALAPRLAAEQQAVEAPAALAFERREPLHLDPGNALVIPGKYRDFDFHAEVTPAPDSIVELRLRATTPPSCRGVALWLPTDQRLKTSFVIEDNMRFEPVGSRAGPVIAGQPVVLDVSVSGRDFAAAAEGWRVSAHELQYPIGSIVLLAARGSADVQHVSLRPRAAAEQGPAPWAGRATATLVPALLVLFFGALVALLLRLPFVFAVQACAFALIPLAIGLYPQTADANLAAEAIPRISFGTIALLLVPCCVHPRALTVTRGAILALAAFALPPAAVILSCPAIFPTGLPPWSGERMEDDLAYLKHPIMRQSNGYLADHRFRGRSYTPKKPAGVARVITLGGSSTWGYGIPEASGQDYPRVLEGLLNQLLAARDVGASDARHADAVRRVEVINAAAMGATGERQFRLLRDRLLVFEPDVVTLSTLYNDARACSTKDEAAELARIGDDDYRRSLLDDLWQAWSKSRGRQQLNALGRAFGADPTRTTLDAWRSLGPPAGDTTPPERFESVLRRYAELGRARGFRLVLIKEPVRAERSIWKDEFGAVIDKVAAEYGLPVVDPSPALQAAGGKELFRDVVHLRPDGLAVVARELAPAVLGSLDGDAGARGVGVPAGNSDPPADHQR